MADFPGWQGSCAAMHKSLSIWVLMGGMLSASVAHASANFAHRNIGLGVSGFATVGDPPASGLTWGLPISLEAGLYLERIRGLPPPAVHDSPGDPRR